MTRSDLKPRHRVDSSGFDVQARLQIERDCRNSGRAIEAPEKVELAEVNPPALSIEENHT